MRAEPRLLSRPLGIEWAGWRTTTTTLQRSGWEIASDFDIANYAYRLLLRHKLMRLYAVTDVEHIERIPPMSEDQAYNMPVFHIVGVAPNLQVLSVPAVDFSRFREIDAEPRVSMSRIERVEDFNIFAAPMPGTKGEVLVDGADMTVVEHLEAIKRLQSAKQREIRDRIIASRREGNEPDTAQYTSNVVALVHYERKAA